MYGSIINELTFLRIKIEMIENAMYNGDID